MKNREVRRKHVDWEELGKRTMLESNTEAEAIEICGLHLLAYAEGFQEELSRLSAELEHERNHAQALHERLYNRAIPVNDAAMLTHSWKTAILLVISLGIAAAGFASNFFMFSQLGLSIFWSAIAGLALEALPLGFGYLFYEKLVLRHQWLQTALIIIIMALGVAFICEFGLARQATTDQAAAQSETRSYVDDGAAANDDLAQASTAEESREKKTRGTFGGALFLASVGAELALGLFVGMYVEKRTDEDFAAWCELKQSHKKITELEAGITEIHSLIEIAKKHCSAGIKQAISIRNQRKTPYHRAVAVIILLTFISVPHLYSQTVEHYEGILIDTSSSIARGDTNRDLFKEYLRSTKRLLATEPPNTQVWVSSIATNSFGGVRKIVKGWTPDAQGIFTADLNHARRQLATSFEAKSASLTANAQGTDIFGGLWHMKILFDSSATSASQGRPSTTIWIFSDMMNETSQFNMPQLLEIGPERMLERAKASGLMVPLQRYEIRVLGASQTGLTPQQWLTIRKFWEMYFTAAGARLTTYSTEAAATPYFR